jgi:hypothetical protein
MAIWYILWSFGIICGHLVYFVVIWYNLGLFGIIWGHLVYFFLYWYVESGNPASGTDPPESQNSRIASALTFPNARGCQKTTLGSKQTRPISMVTRSQG